MCAHKSNEPKTVAEMTRRSAMGINYGGQIATPTFMFRTAPIDTGDDMIDRGTWLIAKAVIVAQVLAGIWLFIK